MSEYRSTPSESLLCQQTYASPAEVVSRSAAVCVAPLVIVFAGGAMLVEVGAKPEVLLYTVRAVRPTHSVR